MAITQSGATVNTGERDSLRSSSVDTTITSGGASLNTQQGTFSVFGQNTGITNPFSARQTTGATLAGVTPSFAQNVCQKIEAYKAEVQGWLDQLQDANSKVAFQGAEVSNALTNFIDSVRTVATSYLNKLSAAEQEIINSVQAAYQTQDTDLSSSMAGDSTKLTSTSIN